MRASTSEDVFPLDPSFFNLSSEEEAFFKKETGITLNDDLKNHILRIQKEAYDVHPYPCIRRFDFIRLKISHHPVYPTLLELGKHGGVFLDIGCCFGNDIRKAISDGYPMEKIVASDLRQGFWDIGHKLFRTDPTHFPIPFICGDIFEDTILSMGHDYNASSTPLSPQDLRDLKSLTPLRHRVNAIHAAALFHLFDESSQTVLAYRLASLFSPEKGSIIFGSHVARLVKGFRTEAAGLGALADRMFCHSEKSWIELWEGIFPEGSIQIDAKLEELSREDLRYKDGLVNYQLIWSITRL